MPRNQLLKAAVPIFVLQSAAVSQSDQESLQRALAKVIGKYSTAVNDLKVKDCRLSVNIDAASFAVIEPNSRTNAGGGFPNDESGGYLSSGPGRDVVVPVTYLRFKLELKDLDPESIAVIPARKKEHSFVVLRTDREAALIDVARNGKTIRSDRQMYLEVRSKGADQVAEAFQSAVKACE
jgi:hypothetical protein